MKNFRFKMRHVTLLAAKTCCERKKMGKSVEKIAKTKKRVYICVWKRCEIIPADALRSIAGWDF